jgi:hypothetical protein
MMKLQIFLKTLIISSLILFHASFAEEMIEITDDNGVVKKCTLFDNGTIVCM